MPSTNTEINDVANNNDNGRKKKKKLSRGVIARIAIGSVFAFLLIILILFLLCGKKKTRKANDIVTVKQLPSDVEIPHGKHIIEGDNGTLNSGGFGRSDSPISSSRTISTISRND
uniref:Uncharacterized protein n=1 Tax=Nelumbo nucifera TaxID=4432 RepID=A0A822YMB9_NELNU|nr:TPA_asm: hypothetical protein HUJ06_011006 [Nelumbo nucifera]